MTEELANVSTDNVPAIKSYTDEEILNQFFIQNQLSEYIEEFKKQKVFAFDIIKDLTEDDLEKLGVETLGDRKRIIKLFSENQLMNFKNKLLYSDLPAEKREELDLPENKILKQNNFKFGNASAFGESGKLALYENRIAWKGDINNFIIPISAIKDVSVINKTGNSELQITDDLRTYSFFIVDKDSIAMMVTASSAGGTGAAAIAGAVSNTKIMTDIEYWRVLIEKQREKNIECDYDWGSPIQEPSNGAGCITVLIIALIAGFIGFCFYLDSIGSF